MNKIKISYDFFCSEQEKIIRRALTPNIKLLPHWLEVLSIQSYESFNNNPKVLAMSRINEPYRTATIEIYNSFFTESKDDQDLIIIHEIIHIYQGAMLDFIKDSVFPFIKSANSDLYKVFDNQYTRENERVTQDLALLLRRNLR